MLVHILQSCYADFRNSSFFFSVYVSVPNSKLIACRTKYVCKGLSVSRTYNADYWTKRPDFRHKSNKTAGKNNIILIAVMKAIRTKMCCFFSAHRISVLICNAFRVHDAFAFAIITLCCQKKNIDPNRKLIRLIAPQLRHGENMFSTRSVRFEYR